MTLGGGWGTDCLLLWNCFSQVEDSTVMQRAVKQEAVKVQKGMEDPQKS